MIDLADVPTRRSDVRFRRVAEEGVVLAQEDARVLGLNEVGARLFELVDGTRTVATLLGLLQEEFDVDRATAEADVLPYLELLVSTGVLVMTRNEGGAP